MKTDRISFSRTLRVAVISAPLWIGLPAHAQQNGYAADEFYRQGDAFSEKVSGFFSGLFKGGRSHRAPNPAPSYPTPAPYQQSTVPTASSSRTTPSTTYREAPSTGAIAQPRVASTKPKTSTTASSRSKRSTTSSNVASSTPKQTKSSDSDGYYTTARKKTESETVVIAPKNQETPPPPPMETASSSASAGSISPYAINDNDSFLSVPPTEPAKSTTPAPSQPTTESKTTPSSTSQPTVSAGQEFPTGTVGKKPGRVVSPYAPHNELDVRGLPSGSLALDPTTQKVFKVP